MPNIAHKPTRDSREAVAVMVAGGIRQESIARILGIDPKTLRKHYAEEIANGSDIATAEVVQSLFRQARSGRVPAATFFWLKTRAGWQEVQHIKVDDPTLAELAEFLRADEVE